MRSAGQGKPRFGERRHSAIACVWSHCLVFFAIAAVAAAAATSVVVAVATSVLFVVVVAAAFDVVDAAAAISAASVATCYSSICCYCCCAATGLLPVISILWSVLDLKEQHVYPWCDCLPISEELFCLKYFHLSKAKFQKEYFLKKQAAAVGDPTDAAAAGGVQVRNAISSYVKL